MTAVDAELELAHEHLTRYAAMQGNTDAAIRAWALCHAIKDLRRPEVAEAMDRERIEKARAA